MITRFDHAVIAAHDLDTAMARYAALGFMVSRGGRHPGHGTENAIIRFGLDHLELLAVVDEAEARADGLNGRALLDHVRAFGGGLAGYALATDDVAADAERLRALGIVVEGPFAMRRERPDGSTLAWQLAVPGGTPWRRPWPFLIEWATPDDERLAREQPQTQPNGATHVASLRIAVRDLGAATVLYRQGLGLAPGERIERPNLAAEGVTFQLGKVRLELAAPHGEGPVAKGLAAEGEGLFAVELAVPDLAAAREYLTTIGVSHEVEEDGSLLLAPASAGGVQLFLVGS